MVRKNTLLHKLAFSLIEVVFTIVVVGVIIMALPTMTEVSSKGVEHNLVQEAIFAASAELNQATSYYWDRNSFDENGISSFSQVINLTGECNATTGLRPGHINQPKHRTCLNDTTINTTENELNNTIPNLHNAAGSRDTFTNNGSNFVVSAEGYKEKLTTTVTVGFSAFGATTQASNNIKQITVSISNDDGPLVVLSTFSANIGEIDYNKRSY